MSAAVQERHLVPYLLGRSSEAEAERIEEQIFTDDEFRANLLALADDLIHAYLTGGLSGADRARFEKHFLASPRHQARVAYLRDLLSALERMPAEGATASRSHDFRTVWALAAALVLLVAGGLTWLVFRPAPPELQQASATPDGGASPVPITAALRPTVVPATQASPTATQRQPPAETRVVRLLPQPEGQVNVALEPRTRVVRIEVPVASGPPSFSAILRRLDGAEVWRMEGLVPESLGKRLVFEVPARMLSAAEYALRIEGEAFRGRTDSPPPVLEYSLRVVKEP